MAHEFWQGSGPAIILWDHFPGTSAPPTPQATVERPFWTIAHRNVRVWRSYGSSSASTGGTSEWIVRARRRGRR